MAIAARTSCGACTTSCPMTVAEPASGRDSVASIRISVVLPAPFGPRMANIMPRGTSRSIPSTARTLPNVLTRPRAEMAGGASWAEVDKVLAEGVSFMTSIRQSQVALHALGLRRADAYTSFATIGQLPAMSLLTLRDIRMCSRVGSAGPLLPVAGSRPFGDGPSGKVRRYDVSSDRSIRYRRSVDAARNDFGRHGGHDLLAVEDEQAGEHDHRRAYQNARAGHVVEEGRPKTTAHNSSV